MIYLDYNATTPVAPEVAEAMQPFMRAAFGNPSSAHALGREAKAAVESARRNLAALIHAEPDEIVFTSGGSESINTAIKGVAARHGGGHFISTTVDHPATLAPLRFLQRAAFTHTLVGVDSTGLVAPGDIRKALRPDTRLITTLHAQNEVGTLEPIDEIGAIAREAGVLFHVDAAQSVGKVPVDVRAMNADLLSIAGHKMYAPKGCGALFIRRGVSIEPLIHGASQESGRRAGTENVIYAAALGKAAELAAECLRRGPHAELRDRLWRGMVDALGERVVLNGHPTRRLPNTLNVSFPGQVGGAILAKMTNICASTGSACHADRPEPSGVLMAMGLGPDRALGAIRFSLGRPTTTHEIDVALEGLKSALA